MKERCVTYVDGYNFYYSIKRNVTRTPIYLAWCDFRKLSQYLLGTSDFDLIAVKYFTAPVASLGTLGGAAGSEQARQNIWLNAIRSVQGIDVVEGYHRGSNPKARKEKQTDVNIAVSMVVDAAKNVIDRAILITSDLDEAPAVKALVENFQKRVDIWLPPNAEIRSWRWLEAYGNVRVQAITTAMLSKSRLPERVQTTSGWIEAPLIWRAPSDARR